MNALRKTPGSARLALACLLLAAACRSTAIVGIDASTTMAEPPRVLAVARPSAQPGEPLECDRVLAAVERALDEENLTHIPSVALARQLERMGHAPAKATESELARAAFALGADAVLLVDTLRYRGGAYVLFVHRSLKGRARLLSADSGETLWECTLAQQEAEGPGQDVELVLGTILGGFGEYDQEAKARIFHGFGSMVARELAASWKKLLPDLAESPIQIERPRIVGGPVEAALRSGEFLTIEARGTEGQTAEALLPGFEGRFPMAEVEPGLYRATIRVLPGMGEVAGPVQVRLHDRFLRYVGALSRDAVQIASPQLEAGSQALVGAADAATLTRWSAAQPRESAFRGPRSAAPAPFERSESRPAVDKERP